MLGEVIGGVDKAANSLNPMKQPMQWLTDNTIGKIPGIGKPAAQAYDYSNGHPLESYLAASSIVAGGEGLGAFGGAAGAGADAGAAADAGSLAGVAGSAGAGAGGDLLGAGAAGSAGGAGLDAATMAGTTGAGGDTAAVGAGTGFADGSSGGVGSWLQSIFQGGGIGGSGSSGGVLQALQGSKGSLGAMQLLSSLYGITQSRKLSKEASAQSVSNAGLQAVQRSMASQGYQSSGNMAAALSKYGADAYGANLAQQQSSLGSTMSSLGLLTAGAGNLAGWGTTPAKP